MGKSAEIARYGATWSL